MAYASPAAGPGQQSQPQLHSQSQPQAMQPVPANLGALGTMMMMMMQAPTQAAGTSSNASTGNTNMLDLRGFSPRFSRPKPKLRHSRRRRRGHRALVLLPVHLLPRSIPSASHWDSNRRRSSSSSSNRKHSNNCPSHSNRRPTVRSRRLRQRHHMQLNFLKPPSQPKSNPRLNLSSSYRRSSHPTPRPLLPPQLPFSSKCSRCR